MNILITGANGLIGSQLSKYLNEGCYNIYKLARSTTNKEYCCWDLLKSNRKPPQLNNIYFDYVIHLASLAHSHDSTLVFESNIQMTKNLMKGLKGCYKHFIFFSSTSIYSEINQIFPIDPTTVGKPYTYYGKSKLHDEYTVISTKYFSILRLCPTISGKGNRDLMKRVYLPFTSIRFKTTQDRSYNFSTFNEINKVIENILQDDIEKSTIRNVHDGILYNQKKIKELIGFTRYHIIIPSSIINILIAGLSFFNSIGVVYKIQSYMCKLFKSTTFDSNVLEIKK